MLEVLMFTLFFEMAYLPDFNVYYGINEKERDILELDRAYQAEAGIDLTILDYLFVKGSMKVLFHKKKNEIWYYPDCDTWMIGAGFRYSGFEAGIEHMCFHPVFPYSSNGGEWNEALINNIAILEGGYTRLYLRLELEGEL